MKKKAKNKEENKEVLIEWYGQIIPVVQKKSLEKEELKAKKQISYEIINKKEENFKEKQENNENIQEKNEAIQDACKENNDKNKENLNDFENFLEKKDCDVQENKEICGEKPREKWNKTNSNKIVEDLYKNSDDYIEQMINELQELVRFLHFSL